MLIIFLYKSNSIICPYFDNKEFYQLIGIYLSSYDLSFE